MKPDTIKQNEMKLLIAAKAIVESTGFEALSIRAVAQQADVSIGTVYHYYDNKESLVEAVVLSGYQSLMWEVKQPLVNEVAPSEEIIERFIRYVKTAISQKKYYQKVMLNPSPAIVKHTSIFKENAIGSGIGSLEVLLQKASYQEGFTIQDIGTQARILWLTIYGLTLRLITEKKTTDEDIVDWVTVICETHFYKLKRSE